MSFVYGELLLNYFKLKEKYPRLARVIAMPTDPWTNNNFIWNKKYFNRGKGFKSIKLILLDYLSLFLD